MKFRARTVIVDAWRIGDLMGAASDGGSRLPPEVRSAIDDGVIMPIATGYSVSTPEGLRLGVAGDMLVRNGAGEFRALTRAAFERIYEPR